MIKKIICLVSPLLLLVLWGCQEGPVLKRAVALIYPTDGHAVSGQVTFEEVNEGVKVVALIGNLSAGKHGFHIHHYGDCRSGDGKSAGGHYNPLGMEHNDPQSRTRHVGDMGNIEANENGTAVIEYIDKTISLNGAYSIIGRGIIVHADADDMQSQPTGAAGARVGCGVIGVAK